MTYFTWSRANAAWGVCCVVLFWSGAWISDVYNDINAYMVLASFGGLSLSCLLGTLPAYIQDRAKGVGMAESLALLSLVWSAWAWLLWIMFFS